MIDKDKDFVSDKVKEITSKGSQSSCKSENNDYDNRKKDSDKSNNNK